MTDLIQQVQSALTPGEWRQIEQQAGRPLDENEMFAYLSLRINGLVKVDLDGASKRSGLSG